MLRIEKGRRTPIFIIRSQVPQKMPSWRGAHAQPPMPAPGDPGQARDQPGLIVEETWMKREKQHAVLILC